ncbi:Phosphatidylinositol alpha-mannosyltransferase [Actinomycetales bacterium JB111]|nr:Phosphatidylinositol alpha-mannosyltransferase [Actinomycetales bacterium JB111]
MRIGIAHPYDVGTPGGVDAHVRQLAAALRGGGHEVEILAPGRAPVGTHETVTGPGVRFGFNGSVARLSPTPAAARRAARWVRDGRFDVVHVHEPSSPSASAFALRAARAAGVPVVATFHAAIDRIGLLRALRAPLRRHLRGIGASIAVSREAARTQREWLGRECEIIPNGVDIGAFAADTRPERDPGRGAGTGPTVVFLGRADEERKGMAHLAAAWPTVRARHPDARLVVAGPGADAARRLLGHTDGWSVLGRISEHDKVALLRDADVFVAPHTGGESFGIVLVEAMAAGAPVVASDLPAFADVLTDDDGEVLGALVPRGRPEALAEAINRVLDDPGPAVHAAALAVGHVARFDWSVVAARVEDSYRRATGSVGCSGA